MKYKNWQHEIEDLDWRYRNGCVRRLTVAKLLEEDRPCDRHSLLSCSLVSRSTRLRQHRRGHRKLPTSHLFARLYGVVRYFYPSDAAAALDWDRFAVLGVKRTRAASDAKALAAALEALFSPLGPGIEIGTRLPTPSNAGPADASLIAWRYTGPGMAVATGFSPYVGKRTHRPAIQAAQRGQGSPDSELFDAVPLRGAHVTVDLGSGLRARVPLSLTENDASASGKDAAALEPLRAAVAAIPDAAGLPDLDMRLAGIVVAWNVFRHFYPYWSESGVDWDARLVPQVELAYSATTRDGHRNALRQLVADARDGHGSVIDAQRRGERAFLPIRFGFVENRVAVTATRVAAEVPVGAVVTTIDGTPATARFTDATRLISGSTQWKQALALQAIAGCEKGAAVSLTIDTGTGPRQVSLQCLSPMPPAETRPDAVSELSPGVWYIDLTRTKSEAITSELEKIAQAAGIVFDVRGYPTDAGHTVLQHLLDMPESDRWMHVAKITGPFGQSDGWQSYGWNLKPKTPRLGGKVMFLTDARAISFAESVMGYVRDRKLGTIVGSATAGTNGNITNFPVPGGFTIAFTGMRVTGHDGQTPFHLVGVKPDVAAAPTLAGLRAGRDDVLDHAVALIRGK